MKWNGKSTCCAHILHTSDQYYTACRTVPTQKTDCFFLSFRQSLLICLVGSIPLYTYGGCDIFLLPKRAQEFPGKKPFKRRKGEGNHTLFLHSRSHGQRRRGEGKKRFIRKRIKKPCLKDGPSLLGKEIRQFLFLSLSVFFLNLGKKVEAEKKTCKLRQRQIQTFFSWKREKRPRDSSSSCKARKGVFLLFSLSLPFSLHLQWKRGERGISFTACTLNGNFGFPA